MPKGSPERTAARRDEIIDACEALYAEVPFRGITGGMIAVEREQHLHVGLVYSRDLAPIRFA